MRRCGGVGAGRGVRMVGHVCACVCRVRSMLSVRHVLWGLAWMQCSGGPRAA